jgi:hypothetical protein
MLVVDLMHEFELGVWKHLFIHLLRILEAADKALINELNRRYVVFCVNCRHVIEAPYNRSFRLVPTFGADTIRRFSTNIAELNKLAARDFEDILQVCMDSLKVLFVC